jgi:hypothetical protein
MNNNNNNNNNHHNPSQSKPSQASKQKGITFLPITPPKKTPIAPIPRQGSQTHKKTGQFPDITT